MQKAYGQRVRSDRFHMVTQSGLVKRCALLAALLAALLLAFAQAARSEIVASGGSLAADGEGSRIVLELSAEPNARSFVADGPPRLVVDLDGVRFDLPDTLVPDGLVTAIRYGPLNPRTGRMVVDLSRPALIARSAFMPPEGVIPGRLVIDLAPADPATFEGAAERASAVGAGEEGALPQEASDGPVVVLDPGHGGIDPGAGSRDGVLEKDLVLGFALRLKARLEAVPGLTVKLTRTDDTFLSLNRRIRVARAYGADLFISIHADAAPQDYVHGATVYTLSERPSDADAATLAARENLADAVSGAIEPQRQEEVSGILADLLRRETRLMSWEFAEGTIRALSAAIRVNSNPHRSARFLVLMAHDIPSVLLELGYLTNEADAHDLVEEAWQAKTADAVALAVAGFFDLGAGAGAGAGAEAGARAGAEAGARAGAEAGAGLVPTR